MSFENKTQISKYNKLFSGLFYNTIYIYIYIYIRMSSNSFLRYVLKMKYNTNDNTTMKSVEIVVHLSCLIIAILS